MKMTLMTVIAILSTGTVALADMGETYNCRWNHEQDGFFTILVGTEETATPYVLVKSDETNYFATKGSAQAENMSLEIPGAVILAPEVSGSFELRVPTYNDSFDSATCY